MPFVRILVAVPQPKIDMRERCLFSLTVSCFSCLALSILHAACWDWIQLWSGFNSAVWQGVAGARLRAEVTVRLTRTFGTSACRKQGGTHTLNQDSESGCMVPNRLPPAHQSKHQLEFTPQIKPRGCPVLDLLPCSSACQPFAMTAGRQQLRASCRSFENMPHTE